MFQSVLLVLLAIVSVQFGASQAKQLFSVLGVAGTSTVRLFFASLIMLAFFRPPFKKLNKNVLLYGLSLGLMNFSFYFALQRVPLGIAVALEFVGPLSVAIFTSKKKIDYIWAVLAGIGILLLIPREASAISLDPVGMMLALFAGVCWAFYIVFGKRASQDLQGGMAASLGMAVAALIVLPAGLAMDGDKIFQVSALPMALVVAVFGSALPYSLEMFALKKLPSQTFGILMSLEPAVAAILGLFVLSEKLSLDQWVAIGCIIVSSLGSTLTNQEK